MDRVITAVQNERIKQLRQLNQKKGRREQGLFLAEGPHLVEEAVKSGVSIPWMVVEEGREQAFQDLLNAMDRSLHQRIAFYRRDDKEWKCICRPGSR